jgi:hypothetical protein
MNRILLLTAALTLTVACEQKKTTTVGVKGNEVTRTCTRAYGSTEAKIAELMKKHGLTEKPPMATKEEFVAMCEKLPLEAAKCLDPVWASADPEGCKAEREKLPEATQKQLENILRAAEAPEEEKPAEGEAAEGEGEGEAAEGEGDGEAAEAEGDGEAAEAEGEAAPEQPAPE